MAFPTERTIRGEHALNARVSDEVVSDEVVWQISNAYPDTLVFQEDKLLLTDYFILLTQQLKPCSFTGRDRKVRGGKREGIEIGFGGLECRHCSESGPRKFFWSHVDRLANSFAGISEHVMTCIDCPDEIKTLLKKFKLRHREQMAILPKGSQKVFLMRMWTRLHSHGHGDTNAAENRIIARRTSSTPTQLGVACSLHSYRLPVIQETVQTQATDHLEQQAASRGTTQNLGHCSDLFPSALVLPEDRGLLTDYLYYLTQQLEICRFSEADRKSRGGKRGNIPIGFGGLGCRHCSGESLPRKFFWTTSDCFANSFTGISDHVLKCIDCPNEVKTLLQFLKMGHREQMAQLPKGSKMKFFKRMWTRLHESGTQGNGGTSAASKRQAYSLSSSAQVEDETHSVLLRKKQARAREDYHE